MALSREEKAIHLFGGQPEDWCGDPRSDTVIHWTGLQVSGELLAAVPLPAAQSQWIPFLTSALQQYSAGLSADERTQRQQRFQAWKEACQFKADFEQWMCEQWKAMPIPEYQPQHLRVHPGEDIIMHESGPAIPPEMERRWQESSQVDKDFRARLYAHPLVITCFTSLTDGKPERCEITPHPYPEK